LPNDLTNGFIMAFGAGSVKLVIANEFRVGAAHFVAGCGISMRWNSSQRDKHDLRETEMCPFRVAASHGVGWIPESAAIGAVCK
jgi:hypothetical protein